MCEPRYWKNLRAYNIKDVLRINLVRSDDVLFGIAIPIGETTPAFAIAAKLNELEEYRSCGCSLDNKCKKHKEKK